MLLPDFEILCMAIRRGEKLRTPREGTSTSVLVKMNSRALEQRSMYRFVW